MRERPPGCKTVFVGGLPENATEEVIREVFDQYRMRIGSSTEKKDSGRIHVDFAQARDDLYEWECQQRLLAREQRHLRFVHEDRLLPPSPPPIVNRRTANNFYSMIQSANSHVRRLMSEKAQHEEEMERAKEAFKSALRADHRRFHRRHEAKGMGPFLKSSAQEHRHLAQAV
ncbi:hypothetical protein F7725_002627 [Dissostichus mawsoni]|uniref:RRM domain-containing protein n=1 Tax=Dissostichus mawsoni TaxID=36200 RepID=A0A7J5Y620_DISMA|nr:hypothetical protein F7725_002627 [Dissostichus mawsoni]